MINILDKSKCCGCEACVQVCPKNSISLERDLEGFLYPRVNHETCIDCKLCEKVCPILNQYDERRPLHTLSVLNSDEKVRIESSSGGVFTYLAEIILKEGGVVFGAYFNSDWDVVIGSAHSIEEISKFRGSKYLQAVVGNSFKECEGYLKKGKTVLFSGTPCQISGLKHFLRKPYQNLLTVDFVCHGVPSPGVWKQYLYEKVGSDLSAIHDVRFRDKRKGWRKFNFVLEFSKDDNVFKIATEHYRNTYMRAFLSDLILRPSCYSCNFKCGRSHSDITIADFWGAEHFVPEVDDDKGLSIVMINNEDWHSIFDNNRITCHPVNYKDIQVYNTAIFKPSVPHPKREVFFSSLEQTDSLEKLILKHLKPSLGQRINSLKKIIKVSVSRIVRKTTE